MSEEEIIVDRVSMIDQWKTSGDVYTQDELNAIGGLLDLYYKQQKEIEKLKEKSYKCEYLEEGAEEIIKNSVSKDKIREKMKKVKKLSTAGYEILKELLGE